MEKNNVFLKFEPKPAESEAKVEKPKEAKVEVKKAEPVKKAVTKPVQIVAKPLTDTAKAWRTKNNVSVEDKCDLPAYESFSEVPVETRFSEGYKVTVLFF